MTIEVFIPTRGRRHRQITAKSLQLEPKDVWMVVPECEKDLWKGWRICVTPDTYHNGDLCAFIQRECPGDVQLVLDDDLEFVGLPDRMKIWELKNHVADAMTAGASLMGFAHDDLTKKLRRDAWVANRSVYRAVAYVVEHYKRIGFDYSKQVLCEDKHMVLTTLTHGLSILRCEQVGHVEHKEARPFDPASGGIARYRTPEIVEADRRALRDRYHGLVRKVRDGGIRIMFDKVDDHWHAWAKQPFVDHWKENRIDR
jgi:hypothetical protein